MRRSDREVTDPVRIEQIIQSCDRMRLGLNDDGEVYIVPLSFGYEKRGGNYVFYFHGASEGRKLDILRKNPCAGFEMDSGYRVYGKGDTACEYSAAFVSIIGTGRVSIVTEREEKLRGLRAVMAQSAGAGEWSFYEDMLSQVCVLRLDAENMTAKEHL